MSLKFSCWVILDPLTLFFNPYRPYHQKDDSNWSIWLFFRTFFWGGLKTTLPLSRYIPIRSRATFDRSGQLGRVGCWPHGVDRILFGAWLWFHWAVMVGPCGCRHALVLLRPWVYHQFLLIIMIWGKMRRARCKLPMGISAKRGFLAPPPVDRKEETLKLWGTHHQ